MLQPFFGACGSAGQTSCIRPGAKVPGNTRQGGGQGTPPSAVGEGGAAGGDLRRGTGGPALGVVHARALRLLAWPAASSRGLGGGSLFGGGGRGGAGGAWRNEGSAAVQAPALLVKPVFLSIRDAASAASPPPDMIDGRASKNTCDCRASPSFCGGSRRLGRLCGPPSLSPRWRAAPAPSSVGSGRLAPVNTLCCSPPNAASGMTFIDAYRSHRLREGPVEPRAAGREAGCPWLVAGMGPGEQRNKTVRRLDTRSTDRLFDTKSFPRNPSARTIPRARAPPSLLLGRRRRAARGGQAHEDLEVVLSTECVSRRRREKRGGGE